MELSLRRIEERTGYELERELLDRDESPELVRDHEFVVI